MHTPLTQMVAQESSLEIFKALQQMQPMMLKGVTL
jgi:hypothetical protein